jgi:hypothetical protein
MLIVPEKTCVKLLSQSVLVVENKDFEEFFHINIPMIPCVFRSGRSVIIIADRCNK